MTKLERGPVSRVAEVWDRFRVGEGTAAIAAAALAAAPTPIVGISIQVPSTSPEAVFVGNQHGQYREIPVGGAQYLNVLDLSLVYVRSVGGAGTYNYIAGE